MADQEKKNQKQPNCMMRRGAADLLGSGNPKEAREAFDRLVDAGASGEEAVQMIGGAVAKEVGEAMREGKHDPDRLKSFLEELK